MEDKILGALLGSAIGDAMGAPIEMWTNSQIKERYAYVTDLLPSLREKEAEAAWISNAPPGTTTDDTRWKFLLGEYLISNEKNLGAETFAQFIVQYYEKLVLGLSNKNEVDDPVIVHHEMLKINWIIEWAKVAQAYLNGSKEYAIAQNRFYGGEMSCAGLLYAPMFGLVATSAEEAYSLAFEHCIFDIGYARDISSLVSVMTYNALQDMNFDKIVDASLAIDPHGFSDSRLLGRIAKSIVEESREICNIGNVESISKVKPEPFSGTQEDYGKQMLIYDRMAQHKKSIAFHAGEIWQILTVSFEYCKGDYEKTMEFIVNYGRDNDTVAAVAGMILGAKIGFKKLPKGFRSIVLGVSKKDFNMDLKKLSKSLLDLNGA